MHHIPPTLTDLDRAVYFDELLDGSPEGSRELVRVARMHRAQAELLEMVNADQPLAGIFGAVIDRVELLVPDTLASIHLISPDGRLTGAVGPSLDGEYLQALNGQEIGPDRGSCGTAAYTRQAVWTGDIRNDPRWAEWLDLAETYRLRACWSVPAVDLTNDKALGTLAVYTQYPRSPDPLDVHVLEDMARIVRIAILSDRAEQQWSALVEENQRTLSRLSRLLEATTQGIYGVDAECRCTFINRAALEMLGLADAGSVLGRDMHELIHHSHEDGAPYSRDACPIVAAIRTGQPLASHDELMYRSDGSTFPATLSAAPTFDPEGVVVAGGVVAFSDETERFRYERQLEAALRSKDEFIASIAHELRTPLTAVVGFADVLRDRWQQMEDDEFGDMVGYISREAAEVGYLVDDLLVAARADLGRVTLRPELVDLAGEARKVLEGWRQGTLQHVEVDVQRDGLVFADPARVRQILRNLLTNALKYGGQNVAVSVGGEDGFRFVEVVDDGGGVSLDQAEAIFEPYARAHDHPGLTASLGLGLAISRRLAQAMGGHLTYQRVDGRTRFRLALPHELRFTETT